MMKKAVLLLAIVTLAVYYNTLHYPFTGKDAATVAENDLIKDPAHIPLLFMTDFYYSYAGKTGCPHINYYRPILSLSYMLDYFIWRMNAFGYRLTNILIHYANGFLVFLIVFGISKSIIISLFTSTLFLVHPVQAGAVAYISGRADSLACLFIVGALVLYVASSSYGGGRRRICYPFSLLVFAMALMTKEVAVLFPLLLLLYDATYAKKGLIRAPRKYLARYAPFLMILAVYIILRCTVLNFAPQMPLLVDPSAMASNFLTMANTVMTYVSILILPTNLSLDNDITHMKSVHDPGGGLLVIGFASLIFLVLMMLRRRKISFFGFLWFLLFILPVSNIVRVHPEIIDQWFYIPSIGFFLMMSVFILRASEARRANYQMMLTIFIILAFMYGFQTIRYSRNWSGAAAAQTPAPVNSNARYTVSPAD